MRVFGDRTRLEDPRAKLDGVVASLAGLADVPAGVERHGALVGAFVEASELAQGLADLEFAARGVDDVSPLQDAAMALLMSVARAVSASWRGEPEPEPAGRVARALRLRLPAGRIQARQAEGYAFYAVYPEAYLEAARQLGRPLRCIGLRSIGAGLAAMAAVASGAGPPVTLRPSGPPFRRQVRVSDRLRERLLAGPAPLYAVVDEGPGLSGSSFGAVGDLLEGCGVGGERVVFLPSHPGDPGPQADPAHLHRWTHARRVVVDFEDLMLRPCAALPPLERWFAPLLGEPVAPLQDLSAGRWRDLHPGAAAPAHPAQERRKFLLTTERGRWLLKFAGLGRDGAKKLERARALHAAGFAPEPAGLRHGFLAERWVEGRPLAADEAPPVERLARYIEFRGSAFRAGAPGASLGELADMVRDNAVEALGEAAGARLPWTRRGLAELGRAARPAFVDARLHRWEWLVAGDGRLVKTDGLDHACAHDLVGAQDPAWDLAGAAVEFDLGEADLRRLLRLTGYDEGERRALFAFMRLAYPAFQLGLWTGADDARAAAYAEDLGRRLQA